MKRVPLRDGPVPPLRSARWHRSQLVVKFFLPRSAWAAVKVPVQIWLSMVGGNAGDCAAIMLTHRVILITVGMRIRVRFRNMSLEGWVRGTARIFFNGTVP